MPAESRLVLFDCDGTLVDSQHHILAAMHLAFAGCGLVPPDAARMRSVVGLSLLDGVGLLLPDSEESLRLAVVEGYRSAVVAARREADPDEPLFPGVREVLDRLDEAGFQLGIATGKGSRGLALTLRLHGLEGRFITLQTADRAPGKPHPAMIHQAVAEAGVDLAATIMVGDTSFDMEMARNAGIGGIGVAWGYHPPEALLDAGARTVVADGPALLRSIATWAGSGASA